MTDSLRHDWIETTLGKIAYINPSEKLFKGTLAPKISMSEIEPFTKKPSSFNYEAYNGGVKFKNGDTLLARITPCLENGKTAFVDILPIDTIAYGSTEFIVIREKQGKSNKDFLYYFSTSPDFRDVAIASMTGSSGRQRVQTNVVENHIFDFPPLPEQNTIAEILSSLDDKIDLLNRQNKTLEALSETLFRQWFIEEADEAWEEVVLGDIAYVLNGYSFKSSQFQDDLLAGYEVFKMGHIDKNGGLRQTPKKTYVPKDKSLEKYVLKAQDIVMAMTDMKDNVVILGVPALIDNSDQYVLNQRVARIYLKNNNRLLSQILLYKFLNQTVFIKDLQSQANSGVQVNLTTTTIKDSLLLIPPIQVQQKYISYFEENYQKILENSKQIQTLKSLRDTLLPKLMSGDVRVRMEAIKQIQEVA